MPYHELERRGWIRRQAIAPEEIQGVLERAEEELSAARELAARFPSSSFELAYNAMLLAATALLYSEGYRAGVERHHKTLVEFTESCLGQPHPRLVNEFDRARRKRHRTVYGQYRATKQEANHALSVAQQLLEVISQKLAKKHTPISAENSDGSGGKHE